VAQGFGLAPKSRSRIILRGAPGLGALYFILIRDETEEFYLF